MADSEIDKVFKKKLDWLNKPINLLVLGLFLGAFTILGLRVLLVQDRHTHYHANFGVFINGERDQFESPLFYEEIQSCSDQNENNPKHRVHMHGQESDVVHVHSEGVTWGAFLANLGYGLTGNLIKTDKGIFIDGQDGKQLTFLLNGKEIDSVANKIIGSADVLLISYGEPKDAKNQNSQLSHNAGDYNVKPDPASCSGDEALNFSERVKRAFDFTQ
jgi:hypothetical protein